MMQGPIKRIVRDRNVSRTDTRVPTAWISESTTPPMWTDGDCLRRTPGFAATDGNAPVLVLLGNECEDARTALLNYAAAGARVYVLVGPGWGKDQVDSEVLQAPYVLIRRLEEVPATAVHTRAEEAVLWIGGGFILRLDRSQAEALRQIFLRLFWHEAIEEAWSGGRQFIWRPPGERPFDIPELPGSALVRWEPPNARLNGNTRGALINLHSDNPPEQPPRRLWIPAGPNHHDRLAKLIRAGTEILWADRGLPDLLVNDGHGEVLLPGTRGRLRVRLTSGQVPEVARLLEAASVWRFQIDVRLGDHEHGEAQFWLPDEPAPRRLKVEQLIELPDIEANSLREVSTTEPTDLPPADPLALAVRYQWRVVPPRVPPGAKEDKMVSRWQKLDEDWAERLEKLREALVAAEQDQRRLGRELQRLASAMLGYKRKHDKLLNRVKELEEERPSKAGPTGAPALLTQLGEIEQDVNMLQADMREVERKAREDEEREKQRDAWQKRVDEANRVLPNRRETLNTVEKERDALKEKLDGIQKELKSANKEAKKDLKARQHKLSDELKRKEKEVNRLRHEISAIKQRTREEFEFKPPAPKRREAQAGPRFVPTTSDSPVAAQVPDEALPEIGSLREYKGKRYLVIETWEQLEPGESIASRLAAELVAPENA